MSFIAELKRRNVIRVGILYAVASWLILQVADVLFGLMGLPDWSLRLVLAILVLGFPIALIFSWVFELTPEGLKRESDIRPDETISAHTTHKLNVATAVLVVVGILVVAADRLVPETAETPVGDARVEAPAPDGGSDSQQDAVAASAHDPRSIAVLPFENFSGKEEDEYFSDGLADTVLHQLAQVRELKVIARNSTFQFKGTNLDVREIGERLGVANVLEGSVQRYGDQVRVIAQLVRTSDGAHVWSQSFDYELDDIFALHDAIAEAVTAQLKVTLLPEDKSRLDLGGTDNAAAYDLVMLASAELGKRFNPSALDRLDSVDDFLPVQLLRRALDLDPDYVDAMLGLARVYNILAWQTTSPERFDAYLDAAEPLVDRALELAPDYSRAWAEKGGLERRRGNVNAAITALERAIGLNPNDASAYVMLAIAVAERDPEATIEYMGRMKELDPEATFVRPKVIALARLGRVDEALGLLEAQLAEDPDNELTLSDFARINQLILGRPDQAARWAGRLLKVQPDSLLGATAMVAAWQAVGDLERAWSWMPKMRAGRDESVEVTRQEIELRLLAGEIDEARALFASEAADPGSRLEISHNRIQTQLCLLDGDLDCAAAAGRRAAGLIAEAEAAGRDSLLTRLHQQLVAATVADKRGADVRSEAGTLLKGLQGLPRTSWGGNQVGYMDAEASTLVNDTAGAVVALEQTLLPGGGFIPYDSFNLYAEDGLLLSRLQGDPGFQSWRERFLTRRDGIRKALIAMEAAGEIPAAEAGG